MIPNYRQNEVRLPRAVIIDLHKEVRDTDGLYWVEAVISAWELNSESADKLFMIPGMYVNSVVGHLLP